MPKKIYRYTDDHGRSHPIQLDVATATAAGFQELTDQPDDELFALVKKNAREKKLGARVLLLTYDPGDDKKHQHKRLPIATKEAWEAQRLRNAITIGETTWKVSDKKAEDYV